MKLKLLIVPIVALVLGAIGLAPQAQAQTPPAGPTSGTKLAGGLLAPRGMKIGPDGSIYIAEAGTAGTMAIGSGRDASQSGFTGRISKVDASSGSRTTLADKLPSNGTPEGDAVGPADVAFLGGQLYYVQSHGGTAFGFPANPTGVYKVNSNGTVTLLADIGAYNIAHPVGDISSGNQQDIEIGGNPYAMVVRDGAFYITDGNQNQILKVTAAGDVSRVAEFPGHPVTTGIAYNGAGPFYVSALGQFPFAPADGKIYSVAFPGGTVGNVASGPFSSLTDVEFGFGGQLYALQFADQATSPDGPPWILGTGKILKVNATTGALTPIVNGFMLPTALIFDGDTAYVANGGATVQGEIWKIPAVSSIQPLKLTAPVPAAPPPTTPPPPATQPPPPPTGNTGGQSGVPVRAPNTGSGPQASQVDAWLPVLIALGVAGVVCVAGGSRMFGKRDR